MNWGEAYLDHYSRYLGQPISRELFHGNGVEGPLQMLAYERVFPETMVFASLGLSHAPQSLGRVAEVVVPVDDGLLAAARIVANALFYAVQNRLGMGRGTVIGGIRTIDPAFALAFGKSAVYFTGCHPLPPSFAEVKIEDEVGAVFMGLFLSPAEEQLLLRDGVDALETALEAANVDPFALRRDSSV